MSRVRVKICGITSSEDLRNAVEAGADAVGFIVNVSQSPRNISMDEARKLIECTPIFIETVAVAVDNNPSQVEKIYRILSPSIIQVHGLDDFQDIREELPQAHLIGAVKAESNLDIDSVADATDVLDAVLVDSSVSGMHGGTGRTHDWEISRSIREAIHPKPLILAGGLTPQNVKEAVWIVKPYAVDVSSGVESRPGVKDREKVFKFVKNAKEVEIR